jgi:hypothetical protein
VNNKTKEFFIRCFWKLGAIVVEQTNVWVSFRQEKTQLEVFINLFEEVFLIFQQVLVVSDVNL